MAVDTSKLARKLDRTPTWAVDIVCAVIIIISIGLEKIIHKLGAWFTAKHMRALFEAFDKVKSELMVLGFISLLLTFSQYYIAKICISQSVADTMLPCSVGKKKMEARVCRSWGICSFLCKEGVVVNGVYNPAIVELYFANERSSVLRRFTGDFGESAESGASGATEKFTMFVVWSAKASIEKEVNPVLKVSSGNFFGLGLIFSGNKEKNKKKSLLPSFHGRAGYSSPGGSSRLQPPLPHTPSPYSVNASNLQPFKPSTSQTLNNQSGVGSTEFLQSAVQPSNDIRLNNFPVSGATISSYSFVQPIIFSRLSSVPVSMYGSSSASNPGGTSGSIAELITD